MTPLEALRTFTLGETNKLPFTPFVLEKKESVKRKETPSILLRPGVHNSSYWRNGRNETRGWAKIREKVLERDKFTCLTCGHAASKYMSVHHLNSSGDNRPHMLATLCVACHAVMHIGRNLSLGTIEIWHSDLSQLDIIRYTRAKILEGANLSEIKKALPLKRGPLEPSSLTYASILSYFLHDKKIARAYLPEPLCAVFVNFTRWQQ